MLEMNHSFIICMSTYYRIIAILQTESTALNKIDEILALESLTVQWWRPTIHKHTVCLLVISAGKKNKIGGDRA